MSVQIEKLEHNMAVLTIEIPVEDFEKAVEKAYQKQKNQINVQGFRKGKAPRAVIEKMYGKEVFFNDALNEAVPAAYSKAYDEVEEEIVSAPEYEVKEMEAGKPVVFTATVALKPGVTLGQYKGIEVDKIDVTVSDEEVDEFIKGELEKNARTVEITDRAVKDGDQTVIDFEGFVDGVAFDGGKGTDYPLTIGSGQFIPGFEEALIGAEIGVETDVNVTFPEEYQEESLAGKPAVFKCTVKAIKEKQVDELTDEVAAELSGLDTVADYKASVRSDIETKKLSDAKEAKMDAVIDAIIEKAEMDIPDAMLETEQQNMIEEFAQRVQSQGLSFEQYMQFTGATPEKLLEQVKPQAESRIKSRLVLEAVAEAEGIEVSDEDFQKEIETMAETYQLEVSKVTELLGEGGAKSVRKDIRIRKAMELVTDAAVEK